MPLHARTLKSSAREAMRAAAPPAVLVTLVYLLLTQVLAEVVYTFIPSAAFGDLLYGQGSGTWMALFLTVLLTIYQAVMTFGYSCWALRTARGEQSGLGSLMEGFGMVGRVLLMEINIFLGILGWTLLLALGYIIAVFTIAFALPRGLALAATILLSIAFYLGVLSISFRYELTHFLLCDYPEDGSTKAVHRSLEMMHGHFWDMVKLQLSFWPWYLLSLLMTLGAMCVAALPILGEFTSLHHVGNLDALTAMLQTAMSGTLATVLVMLMAFPVHLFFYPYQRVSVANFYRALSYEMKEKPPFESEF